MFSFLKNQAAFSKLKYIFILSSLCASLSLSFSCKNKHAKIDAGSPKINILDEQNFDRVAISNTSFTFLQANSWKNQLPKNKKQLKKQKKVKADLKKKSTKPSNKDKKQKEQVDQPKLEESQLIFSTSPSEKMKSKTAMTKLLFFKVENIDPKISALKFTQIQRTENQHIIESMPAELRTKFTNINIEPKQLGEIQAYQMRNQWSMLVGKKNTTIKQESLLFIVQEGDTRTGYILVATYVDDKTDETIKKEIVEFRHILNSVQISEKQN